MKNKKSKNVRSGRKKPDARKRSLHRSLSLHPATLFILLCVGVFLITSTFNTIAATSTSLTMKINALPLKEPAIITQPSDMARFDEPDIKVDGSCPYESYVKLYKNDSLAGVALCEVNKFSLMISLYSGPNQLQARVFNLTDAEGPRSESITVFYDIPAEEITVDTKSPSSSPDKLPRLQRPASDNPFRIIADYKYKIYKSGQPVTLDLAVSGGLPPYALAVEWDNDHTTPVARTNSDSFRVSHVYQEMPRLYTHIVKVAASDSDSNTDFVQLMAVVGGNSMEEETPSESATPAAAGTTGPFDGWLLYIWPLYLIIVLMVMSFYLGEREERRLLLHRRNKPIAH